MLHIFLCLIANCGHPELLSLTIGNDSIQRVVDYDDLPVEGSTITFSCPPGLELIGHQHVWGMENGNLTQLGSRVMIQKVSR